MYEVCFLILNFHTFEETKSCVNSIIQYCHDFKIVIVDNGSSVDEVNELEEYSQKFDIVLLKSNVNLGFAKGNNLGFRYIRENIKCKFIAMCNSDTLLTKSDFVEQLNTAFNKYKFAVLGPDIIPKKSNPMPTVFRTKESVGLAIMQTRRALRFMQIPIINLIYFCFKKIKARLNAVVHNCSGYKKLVPMTECKLHGCFLVFSELYTPNGICDDTFLYAEEDILRKDCIDLGLTMLYFPAIQIIHKESAAVKRTISNRIKIEIFYLKNLLSSYQVLYKKFN
jgi:GT2 family glycosyltransferase